MDNYSLMGSLGLKSLSFVSAKRTSLAALLAVLIAAVGSEGAHSRGSTCPRSICNTVLVAEALDGFAAFV